ncbi:MAG TPA: hypothetical protein DC047_10920 [Blastocatellia bacterium]|nr:hypothetical protein [Blastocatellia bacterium]
MKLACRTLRYIAVAAVGLSATTVANAQAPRSTPEPIPRISRPDEPPDPFASMEEEMRAKRAIKFAEKEYRENIDRAHELADLGSQLGASYKKNQQFDRTDWKKLERLEKLAKAIRNAAGGSNWEIDSDKHSVSLTVNVEELLTVVGSLADRVEKTPRHVVSAAVIDEANVLLELIRLVRELSPKA